MLFLLIKLLLINMTFNIELFFIYNFIFFFSFYFINIFLFFLLRKYLRVNYLVITFFFNLFFILLNLIMLFKPIFFENKVLNLTLTNHTNLLTTLDLSFSVSLNSLSYFFFLLVVLIGCTTNLYTLNYFRGEADEGKFIFWLNSFIVSMLIFVIGHNFFTLFLGWELIGLTSFFLINFWINKKSTLKSSFKAFTFNLFSDICFLTALVCFYQSTGTTDCDTFFYIISWENFTDSNTLKLGLFFLTLCASVKSVQILGHLWLPDSMEAPVPASSLIHSATLVSAGIFLICKFNIIYIYYDCTDFLTFIGSLTAAYGGIVAATQTDMKKLLAYSTMSHCGFLWILAVNGNFSITITYLFLHGIFKASTFYCVGSFIRSYNTQDTRLMGQGGTYLLGDSILLILSAMNLAGLPFTIGVLYKNLFFKFLVLNPIDFFSIGLILIGLLSGVVYFFRLIYYSIFDFYKGYHYNQNIILTNNLYFTSKFVKVVKFNHVLAVSILILFSLFVYIYSIWLVNYNILDFYQPTKSNNDFILYFFDKKLFEESYMTYSIYFYFLYLIIFITLFIFSWRKNYFSVELFGLFMFIFASLFFIFLI